MKRKIPKPLHEVYNDGFLVYGRHETLRSPTRKVIGKEFVEKGKLAYQLMSIREEDYSMAETMGSSVDVKVKTPFPPLFLRWKKSDLVIRIGAEEYEVISVDYDRSKRNLFFYLRQIGSFKQNEEEPEDNIPATFSESWNIQ
ncbi:phage head closure protein [Halobacillus salinus]|uniref:Phage head-tail adapter protein n=1 Tax=Halobacillus salinus TaxID=192814 RepID=A0A4Z0H2S6_9BACI|nr:phage head closure protein [Halobacillus salinus]TGB04693.1 phage head-tail adapter protein [Halobacillus salinus]